VDAATPSTTVNTAFVPTCTISRNAPPSDYWPVLNYIERDVEFNSLAPDCIDRVIAAEVDFRIPLGWDTQPSALNLSRGSRPTNRYCDEIKQPIRRPQLGAGGALVRSEVVRLVEVAEILNLF